MVVNGKLPSIHQVSMTVVNGKLPKIIKRAGKSLNSLEVYSWEIIEVNDGFSRQPRLMIGG